MDLPLNDYLRYQFEWCYTANTQAGMDVRSKVAGFQFTAHGTGTPANHRPGVGSTRSLRELRQAAGLSGKQAAAAAGIQASKNALERLAVYGAEVREILTLVADRYRSLDT